MNETAFETATFQFGKELNQIIIYWDSSDPEKIALQEKSRLDVETNNEINYHCIDLRRFCNG